MKALYQIFAYFGLASISGALLYGFRYDPQAPIENVYVNLGLYLAFAAPHLVMTRSWFKKAVWGDPKGLPAERRVFITMSVVVWLLVFAFHQPIPGPTVVVPEWLRFVGMLGFILSIMAFFQGLTFDMLNGLLGVPGSAVSYSHGPEAPLFTNGPYASVRHPMYQAALLMGLCSLIFHPHMGQLLWAGLIGATFVAFIPIEEQQMIAARGEAYLNYRKQTPYRLIRGIW